MIVGAQEIDRSDKFGRFLRFTTHVSILLSPFFCDCYCCYYCLPPFWMVPVHFPLVSTQRTSRRPRIIVLTLEAPLIMWLICVKIELLLMPLTQTYISVCLSKHKCFSHHMRRFGGDLPIQMVEKDFATIKYVRTVAHMWTCVHKLYRASTEI